MVATGTGAGPGVIPASDVAVVEVPAPDVPAVVVRGAEAAVVAIPAAEVGVLGVEVKTAVSSPSGP